jgi:hypothetical protein
MYLFLKWLGIREFSPQEQVCYLKPEQKVYQQLHCIVLRCIASCITTLDKMSQRPLFHKAFTACPRNASDIDQRQKGLWFVASTGQIGTLQTLFDRGVLQVQALASLLEMWHCNQQSCAPRYNGWAGQPCWLLSMDAC